MHLFTSTYNQNLIQIESLNFNFIQLICPSNDRYGMAYIISMLFTVHECPITCIIDGTCITGIIPGIYSVYILYIYSFLSNLLNPIKRTIVRFDHLQNTLSIALYIKRFADRFASL